MTLVELLISMAIVLLIATLCFPKSNLEIHAINSFTKQLCSDIRYVRSCNILEDTSTYIVYIEEGGNKGYSIKQKGEYIKTVFLPQNTSIKDNINNNIIRFDNYGAPYPCGGTIAITNNETNKEITIVPVSGRVLLKEGKYEK